MKEFPYIEDIYDMETAQLQQLLELIDNDFLLGRDVCVVPDRFESYEKYERKATKLRDSLQLELEERGQVDNVLNFFLQSTANSTNDKSSLMDDSEFYKPLDLSSNNSKI